MRKGLILILTTGVLTVGGPFGLPSVRAQTQHEPANAAVLVAQVKKTSAVIEDVDPQTRQILLRFPDNTLVTLKARKDVENLASLKPGDRITAEYIQARLVGIKPAVGHSVALQSIENDPQGTARGDTTIIAIDPTGHAVSFVGPGNVVQTVHVSGDAMIEAVTKLRAGDRVEVAYVPAVAVAIHST